MDVIPWLAQFKDLAKRHMQVLAARIMRERDGIIENLISKMDVHLVVATCDAFCKYQSGCLKGCIGRAVQKLTLKLGVVDEMEEYNLEQILACFAGGCFETLLFFGDENQRLEMINPAFSRAPLGQRSGGPIAADSRARPRRPRRGRRRQPR